MEYYQCQCNNESDCNVDDLQPNYICPKCNTTAKLIMLDNGCVLHLKDYITLKEISFKMTTEQKSDLFMSLVAKGLNDGQISDALQRIKTKEDYLKYLK